MTTMKVMSYTTTKDELIAMMEECGTVLETSGGAGDTRLTWNRDNADEVETARTVFNNLRGRGYDAYAVLVNGRPGEIITEFNPQAEKMIMAPRMRGG